MLNVLSFVVLSSMLCLVFAVRPEIVDDILPEVKKQGQTAYLNCSVINLQSPAQLQWIKQITPSGLPGYISSDETVRVDYVVEGRRKYDVVKYRSNNREMYQLIIRSLTETDAGNYTCQIYLPNQNYKEWPQKLGELTVQIAPTIKGTSALRITVQEGQNITLNCDANGIPAPNITWKRGDGFPLPNGGFQQRVRENKRYLLLKPAAVTVFDKGGIYNVYQINAIDRGQFICIADNNVKPPASYTVQLEVRFSPYCTAVQDTVGQAQNRRFHAKLECLVAANPRAEVIWYKEYKSTQEKEQIQDNDKYILEQQDDQRLKVNEKWYTLSIKNVEANDYGDYYCTGKNEYGENQAKFKLFETEECRGQKCPSVGAGKIPIKFP
ncbi:lachesin-like isoform X2 [Mytilus californianus]|uniref:lachesin-like isoform X2 n=1 Tax=Mytilus californianus TaxID=6549 RepID=UPI002247A440|nr:lachesin-like isoform X2 [Mytilus californianus]